MKIAATAYILACVLTLSGTYNMYQYIEIQSKVTPVVIEAEKDTSTAILNYIEGFPHLSNSAAKELSSSIERNSKEFGIDSILLTAIISKESSFRHWIRHSDVNVKVPLDSNEIKTEIIKTNAVGLTGVIWEIHKFRLLEDGIITKKSDLYNVDMSIRAMCIVLNYYRDMKVIGTKNPTQSAVLRYYGLTYNNGVINEEYLRQVSSKIGDILEDSIYK